MDDPIDAATGNESEVARVRAWRAEQLGNLGISAFTTEVAASIVDWHEVASLVQRGCPPELAVDIAR